MFEWDLRARSDILADCAAAIPIQGFLLHGSLKKSRGDGSIDVNQIFQVNSKLGKSDRVDTLASRFCVESQKFL